MTPVTEALVERLDMIVNELDGLPHVVETVREAAEALRYLADAEREIAFEVWEGDDLMAASSDEKDGRHYAAVFAQDGPVRLLRAVTYRAELTADPVIRESRSTEQIAENANCSPTPAGEE